jgi:hypothetical protein
LPNFCPRLEARHFHPRPRQVNARSPSSQASADNNCITIELRCRSGHSGREYVSMNSIKSRAPSAEPENTYAQNSSPPAHPDNNRNVLELCEPRLLVAPAPCRRFFLKSALPTPPQMYASGCPTLGFQRVGV